MRTLDRSPIRVQSRSYIWSGFWLVFDRIVRLLEPRNLKTMDSIITKYNLTKFYDNFCQTNRFIICYVKNLFSM